MHFALRSLNGQRCATRPKSSRGQPHSVSSAREVEPPIKRFGHVEEIAGMVHYLCLPEAAYITGQTMHINGGLYYGV